MKFLNDIQAKQWCRENSVELVAPYDVPSTSVELSGKQFPFSNSISRSFWLAKYIENSLCPWSQALLWVTETGIWESSENWHLYYRLRESSSNFQMLEDAPGHLFLQYEKSELISFLQLTVIFGWDAHLLSRAGYMRAFISHDGWLRVWMVDEVSLGEFGAGLE